jgi:hypothetical protein
MMGLMLMPAMERAMVEVKTMIDKIFEDEETRKYGGRVIPRITMT